MFLSQSTLAVHPEARHALLQPSPQRLQLESRPSEPWTLAKTPPDSHAPSSHSPWSCFGCCHLTWQLHTKVGWDGTTLLKQDDMYCSLAKRYSTPLVDSNHESTTEIPKASNVHLHRLAPLQGQQHLQQQQWGFAPLQPQRFNQVGYPNQKAPRFSSRFLGQATSASPSSGSSTLAMATLCSPVAKPSWAQVQRPACSTVTAKNQVFWIFSLRMRASKKKVRCQSGAVTQVTWTWQVLRSTCPGRKSSQISATAWKS